MLLIPVICLLVACVCMAVAVCLVKNNKLSFLFKSMGFVFLICLGIVVANYKNLFNGYSILLILSTTPLFLTAFDIKFFKEENTDKKNSQEDENKTAEKQKLLNQLVKGCAYLVSCICIAIAAFYIGKESFWGILAGVAFGLALTFLDFIIKKHYKNNFGKALTVFIVRFLQFAGIGLLVGSMLCALLYSFALTNILFAVGALSYCVHIFLDIYLHNRFDYLPYFLGAFLMLSTIIL